MVSQLRTPLTPPVPERSARIIEHPWLHAVAGTVQVFTSPHRTFFTNVMVQAMRVAGQGHSVLISQFLKGGIRQGVEQPMLFGQGLEWLRPDIQRSLQQGDATAEEQAAIAQLWQHTESAVMQGRYALVVLDELSLAVKYGLVDERSILLLLEQRPLHADIILTGPEMSESFMELADQVTHFRNARI
jgi:cob(I)alamin adenosyltransferase